MKKLKSIDFKAFFINHGEKCGLGLIVLIVLLALSSTSWSRFEKSPDDLRTKVTEAKTRINADTNVWPQAKSDHFAIVDFNGKARDIFTGLAASKFEFTTPMFWPLYRKKEKARQPEWSAPQYLMAVSEIVALQNRPQQAAGLKDSTAGDAARTEPTNSTLRPPPGGVTTPGGPGGAGGPSVPFGMVPASAPRSSAGGRGPGGGHESGPGRGAPPAGMAGPGMESGFGGASGGTAHGERVVIVTAVVPLREQTMRVAKALNMNYPDASALVEYMDFILERQTAVAGAEPWSGEWEKLDSAKTLEILTETEWDDADPVPPNLTDSVLTSPLPKRLLRYWGDAATHPSIKHFQPTDAERQQVEALQAKVMEAAEKMNLQLGKPRGGFSGITNDIRQTTKLLQQADGQNFMRDMETSMGGTGTRMKASEIQESLTASGRLYLFRFLDFEVQPGMAYRYRVKLVLRNPNYKRNYDEVDNEAFTLKETSETDYSNISNPAVVPETVRYFLTNVERDPVRDDKHSKRPVANIAMFEWNKNMGTMLSDSLKILSVGHFISDKKKSMVLDPATPSYEEKEVAFVTDDILVDASGDLELSPVDHPDLQLKSEKGKKDVKVGVLQEALVATGVGELRKLDPLSQSDVEKALSDSVKEERSNYLNLKDQPKENTSALDGGLYGKMSAPMPGPPGSGPKPTGSSARRRQGTSGGSSSGGSSSSSSGSSYGGNPAGTGGTVPPAGRTRPR